MKDGSRWQLLLVVTRCHISADFESRGCVSLVSMPNQHLITTCHEEANNLFRKNGDVKKTKKTKNYPSDYPSEPLQEIWRMNIPPQILQAVWDLSSLTLYMHAVTITSIEKYC